MRISLIGLPVFLFLLFGTTSNALETKAITLDAALKQEEVGDVLIDPEGHRIVFQKVGPYDAAPGSAYQYGYFARLARSEIHVADMRGGTPSRQLFEQEPDTGYWPGSFSPDGQRLAFFTLRNETVRAGVYSFATKQVRYFDFFPHYLYGVPRMPIWLSDDEAIFVAKLSESDTNLWLDQTADQSRGGAGLREQSWRGESAVSVVGGGRYRSLGAEPQAQYLLKIDVRTGEPTRLSKGNFSSLSVSKDGRYVAGLSRTWNVPLDPDELLGVSWSSIVSALVVYDTRSGKQTPVCPDCTIAPESLFWSPEDQKLLFHGTPLGEQKTAGDLYIYDASSGNLTKVEGEQGFIGGGIGSQLDQIVAAGWVGGTVVYRQHDPDTGRQDWVSIGEDGRETSLTVAFSTPPTQIAAASKHAVLFVDGGDVWRVGLDGVRENQTENFDSPLRHVQIGIHGDLLTWSRIAAPEALTLIAENDARKQLVFLDADAHISATMPFPKAAGKLLGSSPAARAAVFQSDVGGSRLLLSGSEGEPTVLHEFNPHLKGIVGARAVAVRHETKELGKLTSWLLLPSGAREDERRPMIVTPYAGAVYDTSPPVGRSQFDSLSRISFDAISAQLFTAAGYAVLVPSIPLKLAPGEPMTEMMPPILSAVDAAIDLGYVDRHRLGLRGQSYGGYSVMSIIAQTDRFKAAVSSAGLSNLVTMYGQFSHHDVASREGLPKSAYMMEQGQGAMGAAPWQDPDRYVRNSPLFHAHKINTPLMLIHGDLDGVNIAQSEQMYTALYRQDKDVVFLRYFGEGHTISSPANVRDMWRRKLEFFDEHLGSR